MNAELNASSRHRYHIRVEGMMDKSWEDWLDGFALVTRDDSLTLLTGEVQDQSALHGILARLHSLGLKLLLVARVDCPCSSASCKHRHSCKECALHETGRGALPACMRVRAKWETQVLKIVSNRKER
jgi:hypothetical protein